MEKITYREVLPADLDSIRQLYDSSFPIKYDDAFYEEVSKKNRKGNKVYTYVATINRAEGDHLVGAITFQIAPLRDRDHDSNLKTFVSTADVKFNRNASYIMTVATHCNFKRKGIASQLIEKCQRVSRQIHNCVMTYLHVIYWNDSAMALYTKHGFSELTFLPEFYHFDSRTHDAYLFGKKNILSEPIQLSAPPKSIKRDFSGSQTKYREGSIRQVLKSLLALRM